MFERCQWKYKRTIIDKVSQPESAIMQFGTIYHEDRNDLVNKIKEEKLTDNYEENYNYIRNLLPEGDDEIHNSIAKAEAERSINVKKTIYKPVYSERKFETIFCDPKYFKDYPNMVTANITDILTEGHIKEFNEVYGIDPVINIHGVTDEIYRNDDGTYAVFEFKTGSFNSGTSSKIRKELIFYKFLVSPHLDQPVTRIGYHYAAKDQYSFEDIKKRSITSLKNLMYKFFLAHITNKWTFSYYWKFCNEYCNLNKECRIITNYRR